ncbi:MAG: type II secretion system protein GspM [Immundisolibacteraceae bacterium]|nr:type II secretion system protein GspM [Immundisolibacteraceae bacterium]
MIEQAKTINRLLGVGCLVLVITGCYLTYANSQLSDQIAASQARFDELQTAISTPVKAQRPPAARRGALAIMKQIELEAKRADLDELLTRMEQHGNDEIHLLFESVNFNALIAWLDQVYQSTGLQPHHLSVSRRPADNRVTARAIYR